MTSDYSTAHKCTNVQHDVDIPRAHAIVAKRFIRRLITAISVRWCLCQRWFWTLRSRACKKNDAAMTIAFRFYQSSEIPINFISHCGFVHLWMSVVEYVGDLFNLWCLLAFQLHLPLAKLVCNENKQFKCTPGTVRTLAFGKKIDYAQQSPGLRHSKIRTAIRLIRTSAMTVNYSQTPWPVVSMIPVSIKRARRKSWCLKHEKRC